ncbi:MAG: prepilin-type N-terminal cleavage/methylation domain-containing protein [Planctomycetes bacterium]|nr:prepilin-type N-terminal cleavage/methylation domain-containing protein [Planctomycetota bacterium]MCB9910898.1 prepilin-type N-terminal cleavage/methylation domain-containing protein [Planctomycetota bacterium]MCB9912109.1 prepilin-type N-terminal cleavage/methylation domain-containing protein [Planctomycetota bacterium]
MKHRIRTRRTGFTLIEVLLTASILGVLARSLILLADGMGSMSQAGGSLSLLQLEASKAQDAIMEDLRRSGLRTVGGKSFPHVFEGGLPGPGFEIHGYAPSNQAAQPGDLDFGPQRSVVFLLPADLDGDGRPDMDADLNGTPELDGNRDGILSEDGADLGPWDPAQATIDPETGLVWSLSEWGYAVVDGADGRPYLERRRGGALQKRVAKDVERMFIETCAQTGYQIPANALRITLFLRRTDTDGVVYRHSVQWVVSLRNGELE